MKAGLPITIKSYPIEHGFTAATKCDRRCHLGHSNQRAIVDKNGSSTHPNDHSRAALFLLQPEELFCANFMSSNAIVVTGRYFQSRYE
jgi:hypothetical protein